MKQTLSKHTINWFESPGVPGAPMTELTFDLGDMARHDIPTDPAVGRGVCEITHYADGMMVAWGLHTFTPAMTGQLLPPGRARVQHSTPVFQVRAASQGRVVVEDHLLVKHLTFGHGQVLCARVQEEDFTPWLDANSTVETVTINIAEPSLHLLLGEELVDKLFTGLNLVALPSVAVHRLPLLVEGLLHHCHPRHLQGRMRMLYTHSRTLEFLFALSDFIFTAPPISPSNPNRNAMVQALHDELCQTGGRLPTLPELARQYGLSAKLLNAEFRKAYGQTIYAFATDRRLIDAHEVLRTGQMPIKQLAAHLGYSSVNHFNAAFRKKFGYTPGSLNPKKNRQPPLV